MLFTVSCQEIVVNQKSPFYLLFCPKGKKSSPRGVLRPWFLHSRVNMATCKDFLLYIWLCLFLQNWGYSKVEYCWNPSCLNPPSGYTHCRGSVITTRLWEVCSDIFRMHNLLCVQKWELRGRVGRAGVSRESVGRDPMQFELWPWCITAQGKVPQCCWLQEYKTSDLFRSSGSCITDHGKSASVWRVTELQPAGRSLKAWYLYGIQEFTHYVHVYLFL